VNFNSPLVIGYGAQPTILDSAREQELANDSAAFSVGRLRSALSVETAHSEMMRKVATAPIALNYLAVDAGVSSPRSQQRSGGPMRRVSTSIGPLSQRRTTSFMWSMDVHRDFEHAVQTLLSRVRSGCRSRLAPANAPSLGRIACVREIAWAARAEAPLTRPAPLPPLFGLRAHRPRLCTLAA
jgi:hypothetical protein